MNKAELAGLVFLNLATWAAAVVYLYLVAKQANKQLASVLYNETIKGNQLAEANRRLIAIMKTVGVKDKLLDDLELWKRPPFLPNEPEAIAETVWRGLNVHGDMEIRAEFVGRIAAAIREDRSQRTGA